MEVITKVKNENVTYLLGKTSIMFFLSRDPKSQNQVELVFVHEMNYNVILRLKPKIRFALLTGYSIAYPGFLINY